MDIVTASGMITVLRVTGEVVKWLFLAALAYSVFISKVKIPEGTPLTQMKSYYVASAIAKLIVIGMLLYVCIM